MNIKQLKRKIEFLDDDVEVVVCPYSPHIFSTFEQITNATLELGFQPPVQVGPNHHRMELAEPQTPRLVIRSTKRKEAASC